MSNGLQGGSRKGSGRKPGALTKASSAMAAKCYAEGITPLEYMLQILRKEPAKDADPIVRAATNAMRFEAAKAAAPYMHARLASTEVTGANGSALMPPTIQLVRDADSA